MVMAVVAYLWLRNQPASQRKPAIIKLVVAALAIVLAVLAVTGRLYLVAGLLAGMLPFLRRLLPGLLMGRVARGMGGGGDKASSGNRSHVSSDILEMTLDHDSGEMDGSIVKGPFQGRMLADLGETEFIDLLQYCRQNDTDSARLLETYLDRRFGDSWRDDDPGAEGEAESKASQKGSGGPLTEEEARDILGVEPDASRAEIIKAHRRMMQKLHPDRGGSNYLAARINEAKARLLD
ncbi:MAG: DnaJ domain-containing protein [Oleiphilaceae bacterium]|nr:DnaJ domain-containing protein [Oleiphilaceae bacterium]